MQPAQPFTVRTAASRTIADLRRDCTSLFLGHRAEIEERLALAQHDDDPRIADRVLDDMQSRIDAQQDRVAAEDAAFNRAPRVKRRIEAGHRFLLVTRNGEPRFVPLVELTDAELAVALDARGPEVKAAALPAAAPEPDAVPVQFDLRRPGVAR